MGRFLGFQEVKSVDVKAAALGSVKMPCTLWETTLESNIYSSGYLLQDPLEFMTDSERHLLSHPIAWSRDILNEG